MFGLSGGMGWSGGHATRFLLIFWISSPSVVPVLSHGLLMEPTYPLIGLRGFWFFWLRVASFVKSLWVILVVTGLRSVV